MKTLIVLTAIALMGCTHPSAPVQFVAEEQDRAAKYHKLAAEAKADKAAMDEFITGWLKVCKAKNQVLTMDVTGDPGCAEEKPQTTGQAAPVRDQKAIGMKGTVQVP